jgi:hypothetical protein
LCLALSLSLRDEIKEKRKEDRKVEERKQERKANLPVGNFQFRRSSSVVGRASAQSSHTTHTSTTN